MNEQHTDKEINMTDMTMVMGANATGKSTRFKVFVDALVEKYGGYDDYSYTFFDTKKDETRTVDIGRLFPNGYLVLGSEANNQAGWVCLDKAILSTQDMRTNFYKHVINKDHTVKHVFAEGYFNTMSPRSRPNFLRETGFNSIDCFFLYYEQPEDYLSRTNSRAGKERGMDWAIASAGWKDNLGFGRAYIKTLRDEHDPSDDKRVFRLNNDSPKDYFVEKYLGKIR
jgi:energy-coupling factor transporter ATP-binding protein EcfA2